MKQFSKTTDAPSWMQILEGKALTLEQINHLSRLSAGVDSNQAAIALFKMNYSIQGIGWVRYKSSDDSLVHIHKEDSRYKIVTISTAATADREGETFTTEAIDWDVAQAKETGIYPEYRVFHSSSLGIGRVEKMYRVGIFAVDEGYSYTDPFSLQVVEKMLLENPDGKWRVSRGFVAHEISGNCPECDSGLFITKQHMLIGFKCPTCGSMQISFKGALTGIRFLKARTFDVTITDVPAVEITSAQAFPITEAIMSKESLKKRLIEAGIDEDKVDARLKEVPEDVLKELLDIPDATLLKELKLKEGNKKAPMVDEEDEEDEEVVAKAKVASDEEDEEDDEEDTVEKEDVLYFPEETLHDIAKAVVKELGKIDVEVDVASDPSFVALKESVDELATLLGGLDATLKEFMGEGAPRASKVRVKRHKERTDDDDAEITDTTARWIKSLHDAAKPQSNDGGVIVGANGKTYASMSDMVRSAT